MASCSKTRNPYQFCNDDEQYKDEDEYRSRHNSGFLHDYPSHHSHHHHVHVQTSNNGVVLAESTNDHQFLTTNTTHNQVQFPSFTIILYSFVNDVCSRSSFTNILFLNFLLLMLFSCSAGRESSSLDFKNIGLSNQAIRIGFDTRNATE